VPGRTGCDMLNDTVLRLCELPNIVGIKDATGNLERGRDLLARCPADFAVYSGDDATAAELMLAGGRGNISVTANVDPARIAALCRAALAVTPRARARWMPSSRKSTACCSSNRTRYRSSGRCWRWG
jgi:4-hydroxy-tetrahydrodipicolinate synthase